MRRRRSTGLALAAIVTGVAVFAQAPAALSSFEVASVPPNTSSSGDGGMGTQRGGRLTATDVALRTLIRTAFSVQDFQIDAPQWLDVLVVVRLERPTPD